jgi:hypothetical protein
LQAFLASQTITEEEKNGFLRVLDRDAEAFFKRLFVVIDRLDNSEKAELIGMLFSALVKGKINSESFLELTTIIENAYVKDLNYLLKVYASQAIPLGDEPSWQKSDIPLRKLSSLGLLNHESSRNGPLKHDTFDLTPLGKLFLIHASRSNDGAFKNATPP